jgi:hypothetical protein
MTKKGILIRSVLATLLALTAGVVGYLYFSSGLYNGARAENTTFHFLNLLTYVAFLVVAKLFIYDLISAAILKRESKKASLRIFYIGYILALAIDMASIYMAHQPVDMNLSIFATILYSPAVLFLALMTLIAYKMIKAKPVS